MTRRSRCSAVPHAVPPVLLPTLPASPRVPRLAIALTALLSAAAGAQTSPYYIGLSQNIGHESNVLRLLDGQAAPEGFSKSDTVSSTALVAGIDQPIGRQRLFGNAVVRYNKYSDNSDLDYTGYSGLIGLDWATINRLSGNVTATANRSLQNINTGEIVFQRQKNLETVKTITANAALGVVTQYTLEANAGYREGSNSLVAVQPRDYRQDNAGIAVRYRPTSASSFGLGVGTTRGRYPKFRVNPDGSYETDRFKREDINLLFGLQPSGASSIDAQISSGRTRYDLNTQRDFSGVTGSINWIWQATGKLRFTSSYSRDTGQDSYATVLVDIPAVSDYSRVVDTVRVLTEYALSAKISFSLSAAYYKRDLVSTFDNVLISRSATGRENTTALTFGARWVPLRYLQTGCDLGNERRRGSGELGTDLKSTSIGCYAQITLQ